MGGYTEVVKEVLERFKEIRGIMHEHESSNLFDVVDVYAEQMEDELSKILDDVSEDCDDEDYED